MTAAEYARQCDPPMGKPAMSRLFAKGLPNYPGKDAHGRDCKYVLPDEADQWRALNCRPTLDGKTGAMRGAPDLRPRSSAPASPAPASAREAVPPSPSASSAGGEGAGDAMSIALRIQEARATSAEEDAKRRTYARLKDEGALLDKQAAIDAHLTFVGMVASALDRMPADMATTAAATLGVAEHDAFKLLRTVAERLRDDLASAARKEKARLALEG